MIDIYKAPDERMKRFLVESIRSLTGFEKLSSQELSKVLIDNGKGRKLGYNTNTVSEYFPWLHKIGVIDFEKKFQAGWRLYLFRKCGLNQVEDLIMESGDFKPPEFREKKKKKNKCCNNSHIVRNRKTGKRRCKNCGKKFKSKPVA